MHAEPIAGQPSAQEAAQMRAEARQAAREAAQAQREAAQAQREAAVAQAEANAEANAEAGGRTTVRRNAEGRTVIETPDGRTVVIDRSVPGGVLPGEQVIGTPSMAPHPPFPGDGGPPESVIVLTGLVMFFLTLMLIGFPIARAFARRMDRRGAAPSPSSDMDARLQRIEHAVDAIAVEVERVSEGQRFATRLLNERAESEAQPLSPREGMHAR
jgi:multidrug efflux pump subunit AcrA (membrane-fusion protein)